MSAIGSVDIKGGFPDFQGEFYGFHVDPFEANRVWYTARGRGTNTGPLPPFAPAATGREVVNPPQACSLTFNEDGLVTKYTIGYVMDRHVGNTGGLGGLYGIMYAIGKPLPFPEARPWKMSKRYRLFNALGNFRRAASANRRMPPSPEDDERGHGPRTRRNGVLQENAMDGVRRRGGGELARACVCASRAVSGPEFLNLKRC